MKLRQKLYNYKYSPESSKSFYEFFPIIDIDTKINTILEKYPKKTELDVYTSKVEISSYIPEINLDNVISKNELIRGDIIDVIEETDGTSIILTAEDTISNGMIAFRIFMDNNAQKNCYIKFENNEITDYKGI